MPSDTKTYQEETYIDNTIRLRGVLNTMPDFASVWNGVLRVRLPTPHHL